MKLEDWHTMPLSQPAVAQHYRGLKTACVFVMYITILDAIHRLCRVSKRQCQHQLTEFTCFCHILAIIYT